MELSHPFSDASFSDAIPLRLSIDTISNPTGITLDRHSGRRGHKFETLFMYPNRDLRLYDHSYGTDSI